jgi:hypothetical protein
MLSSIEDMMSSLLESSENECEIDGETYVYGYSEQRIHSLTQNAQGTKTNP